MSEPTSETHQQCQNCRNFARGPGGILCRLAPPQPLMIGMTQGRPGAAALLTPNGAPGTVTPIIQGFFAPTAPDNWCAQWRPMDFTGNSPELPARPKMEYRT